MMASHEERPPVELEPIRTAQESGGPSTFDSSPDDYDVEPGLAVSRTVSGPAYSAFPRGTKLWITSMIVVASFISPVTANIYFPALNPIAEDLNVSIGLINLTLTTYMIFQGLAPTLFGDFGDQAGRRPAYILAFTIYFVANIGLALQRNYAALLVLRCLQSAGSSGTIALGYAVVADLASPAERGRYMGFVQCGVNVGPALGPTLGGLLSQYLGWPAIFWFLAIFVFVWLVPWIIATPESCRQVVGNGSVVPPRAWNKTVIDLLRGKKRSWQLEETSEKPRLRFPNPLKTLVVVRDKESCLILITCTFVYLQFILIAATLGTIFEDVYGYNDLQVGLCYLPYGAGCCVATVAQGYIVDWNFARIAKKMGRTIDRRKGVDLSGFPIESVRIQPIYPALTLGTAVVSAYGWCLQAEVTVAAPLVLLFFVGMFVTSSFSVLGTLMVDIYPKSPATATAALNLVRCLFGAVATAVIDYMLKGMGRGWTFTFLALVTLTFLPVLRLVEKRGMRWRAERKLKEEKDIQAKQEAAASSPEQKH
jgi:multidrug resistance protein